MKFLLDTNPKDVVRLVDLYPDFVAGQLICPVHSRANWGGVFAMDNSAFSSFNLAAFLRMQNRNVDATERCQFVTCPDIVGNMRRTLELWRNRDLFSAGFSLSLVLQDGAEDMDIPWTETQTIFIGGIDPWKESCACRDLIKTAKMFGLRVHCGRINQIARFEYMASLGVDTCDGSGVSRFGYHQLLQIIEATNGKQQRTLFAAQGVEADGPANMEI